VLTPLDTIRNQIIARLQNELDPGLIYHNASHTRDVLKQAESIALEEGILPGREMELLKTAAAFHDCGFLYTYKKHEEKSCEMMRAETAGYFTEEELEKICGMIMATKIPQTPHNLLEKIICDADLDYLGRDDFETISENLRKEFIDFEVINRDDNWNEIQINFFEFHNYFTPTSSARRDKKKDEHLLLLKKRNS
jgi:uncharacterized protein